MSNKYQELLQQQTEIKQKIEAARQEIIQEIKETMKNYGISIQQIDEKQPHTRKTKVGTPKYKNLQTGETWTGKGRPPTWIEGNNREDFLIKE